MSPQENLLLAEDFSEWGRGNTGDGTKDWGYKLDDLMANKGWKGFKVYKGAGRMKLGTSTGGNGYIQSPLISKNNSLNVTVSIVSKTYKTDTPKINLSLADIEGDVFDRKHIVPNGTRQLVVLDNPKCESFSVRVQPEKRCYIYSISIYDGAFSESDFAATRATGDVVSVNGVKDTVDERNGITPSTIVSVYSLSGVLLGRMSYASFLRNGNFAGVYILKSGAKTFKMTKG